MGKGNAKFGYKSGTLPEVRQIFKNPTKPIVRPANPNVGYAEGIQHPTGTSRVQPLPEVKSVDQLIRQTAKVPKKIPVLKDLNDIQKAKVSRAALRREYYIQSLKQEESRLKRDVIRKQKQRESEAQKKAEATFEISEATRLTLPTIDSLLDGPFMRQRTEEEKELLNAKRTANRLQKELEGKSNRAVNLLELYYEAENYIVNEKQLASAIDVAFGDNQKNNVFIDTDKQQRSHDAKLQNALFGKINEKPGLIEVEEQLSGERSKFEDDLKAALENKIREARDEARD